jgi:EAL domain-containing protein (putative c-di-GMP-specific phosphodiesterase class I)
MAECPGCELLPSPLPATGKVCLWPPLGHTSSKIRQALATASVEVEVSDAGYLSADATPRFFEGLRRIADEQLSEVERDQCKYLHLPLGEAPSMSDFGRVNSLTHLVAHISGRWLVELLTDRRITTHFQPIVHAADPERVFAYECLLRGIDDAGKTIPPGKLYQSARSANLLYHLDRSSRLQHIAAIARHGMPINHFINFNPTSIYDPEFCLRSTVAAIKGTGLPPESFVFEVVESDHVSDLQRLPYILDYYRRAGFRVALDDLGAGFSSLNLLSALRPDFVKLDMELLRGIDENPYKGQLVSKIIETAHDLGIEVVAEGIETVGEWNWAAAHGANYIQGYLFGRPHPTPQPSCADWAATAT